MPRMMPDEVKEARAALGLTQKQLAEALELESKLSKDTVRGWEAGRRAVGGPEGVAIRLLVRMAAIDAAAEAKRPKRKKAA